MVRRRLVEIELVSGATTYASNVIEHQLRRSVMVVNSYSTAVLRDYQDAARGPMPKVGWGDAGKRRHRERLPPKPDGIHFIAPFRNLEFYRYCTRTALWKLPSCLTCAELPASRIVFLHV